MTPEVSYFFSCGDSFQPDLLNLHVGRQGCFLPLLKTASPANSSGKEIIASPHQLCHWSAGYAALGMVPSGWDRESHPKPHPGSC